MPDVTQDPQTEAGDSPSDLLVCSALCYLDSSNSFREYLAVMRGRAFQQSHFVLLDDVSSTWGKGWIIILTGVLVGTICLLWLRG